MPATQLQIYNPVTKQYEDVRGTDGAINVGGGNVPAGGATEDKQDASIAVEQAIADNTDEVETKLEELKGLVNGLETAVAALEAVTTKLGAVPRQPLYATITASNVAVELSTAVGDGAELSNANWILIVPGGGASIRLGTSTVTTSTQLRIVAPTDPAEQRRWTIPSSSLAAHWVISEGANVDLELVGEQDT